MGVFLRVTFPCTCEMLTFGEKQTHIIQVKMTYVVRIYCLPWVAVQSYGSAGRLWAPSPEQAFFLET